MIRVRCQACGKESPATGRGVKYCTRCRAWFCSLHAGPGARTCPACRQPLLGFRELLHSSAHHLGTALFGGLGRRLMPSDIRFMTRRRWFRVAWTALSALSLAALGLGWSWLRRYQPMLVDPGAALALARRGDIPPDVASLTVTLTPILVLAVVVLLGVVLLLGLSTARVEGRWRRIVERLTEREL